MDQTPWWKRLNVPVTTAIAGMHLAALAVLYPPLFSWSGFYLFLIFCAVSGFGVTVGYHRLLSHNSFRTPRWFRYILALCGCVSWQGGPISWVGAHRLHHGKSDKPGDLHSPSSGGLRGFLWAHVGWLCVLPDPDAPDPRDGAQDLARDPGMVFLERYFWAPQALLTAALAVAGFISGGVLTAASWVIWAVALRTVVVWHITWSTNSITHLWGYRNYETRDDSRNNVFVGFFGLGEGWHNNHHWDQGSAAHGCRHWWELDFSYLLILALSLVGLATDIKKPRERE